MTEKKRQSTVQPEQTQGFASPAEDELDLIDLLKFLARRKVFILAVTSVCTLFSIFYVQSITPIYRATVGLIDHHEFNEGRSSFSALKQLEQIDPMLANQVANGINKPHTLFERLLFNIRSYELKHEVFVNGGFQKKFPRETGIDTDRKRDKSNGIERATPYNSTKIVKRDRGAYLELEGFEPKVMLEFLTALVEAAKENVNTEINDIQRAIVQAKIDNLSTQEQIEKINEQIAIEEEEIEIEELHQKITEQKQMEKVKRAIEIARFSEALTMAKRMGIKNNNFDQPSAPVWFRYGELALPQEITSLRSKKEEIPNTKSIPLLKLEAQLKLKRFQQEKEQKIRSLRSKIAEISKIKNLTEKLTALPLLKFKIANINKHSYSPLQPNQRLMIVGFGVAFGLVISIFMVFLIDLKQLRAKEIPSAST